ncbi:hypothetical protein ACTXGQ_11510 [Marinobacter sp. 1Y8]
MATPSLGAQHYVLLLLPRLLKDMEQLGLRQIINRSSLPERDITALYFEARLVARALPQDPKTINADIWAELLPCIRALSLMVAETSSEARAKARASAITHFLPEARITIKRQFEHTRQTGDVDFRLASLSRASSTGEQAEATCLEALRLTRNQHYQTMMQIDTNKLNNHQAIIVEAGKAYVRHHMAQPPEAFGALDLLLSLINVLRKPARKKDATEIDSVVLGMGHLLYGVELELIRQRPTDEPRRQHRARPG